MNADELRLRFPNASPQFIALNTTPNARHAPHRNEVPAAVAQPAARPRPLAKKKAQGGGSGRYVIRLTSYRVRLTDEDNLCAKLHVDALRYAGIIPDDSPGIAKIEVGQIKVGIKAAEKTVIEVTFP